MTEHDFYFIKQRLIGLGILLLSALTIYWLDGNATLAVILLPIGLTLVLSRRMWIVNDHYFDVMDENETERL